jgi:signal transduction histidine kinase
MVKRVPSTLALALLVGATSLMTVVVASGNGGTHAQPTLHAAVETVIGMVAVLATLLAFVRLSTRRRLDDVLLAAALAILATSHVLFLTAPALLEDRSQHWLWSSATGRLGGALVFAVAAFVPDRPIADARRGAVAAAAGAAILVAAIGAGFALAEPSLPVDVTAGGELWGSATVFAIHVATVIAFAAAATGYFRQWRHGAGIVAEWIGTAAALAAIARIDYLMDPAAGLSSVHVGDSLRVVVYMLLVLGLERDVAARGVASAVRRERRRVARELHDGLAQDLAFILRRARASDDGGELATAAERALMGSRQAIAALRHDGLDPLHRVLADAVQEVGIRFGKPIDANILPSRDVLPDQRDALVAIAREAVVNAIRHAEARHVRVELNGFNRVYLRVSDDGVGFDMTHGDRGGFGLVGMRERAEAIGATLRVSSRVGGGTDVEVVLL